MVELAAHILASKETRFDPRKFKDEYEAALKKLVARKAKGHAIEEPAPAEEPSGNVISLMDALRQSLGKRAARPPRKRRARKTARSRKAA
jgi:non-homologous end joining protein Ku